MNRSTILCAGYLPLDLIATPAGLLERRAGGTAGNVAAILAHLGWGAAVVGQIGDDLAGDLLLDDLRDADVDVGQIRSVHGRGTPRLIHAIRTEGHSYAFSCPICGSRFPRSRPLTIEMAENCLDSRSKPDVYFFDRLNAGTLLLAERFGEEGSLVMFEPSMPASAESLERALAVADIVKYSADLLAIAGDDHPQSTRTGQIRIVTYGSGGLRVSVDGAPTVEEPAIPASDPVDGGGAGDWTSAGLLYEVVRMGRVRRENIEAGIQFGQALASLNCTLPGARGLMRLKAETIRRRARAALRSEKVLKAPRLPAVELPGRPAGLCGTCLTSLVSDRGARSAPAKAVAEA